METTDYNFCVREWADAIFRFACKCTGNEEDARDVVQGSFEILWQKRQDVTPEKAKAFLFQVAYRQSIDNFRKKRRLSFVDPVENEHVVTIGSSDLKRV